jgi:hypothetical protein
MTTPIVTELKRYLEPVTTDPFVEGLGNDHPSVAPTTVTPEDDAQRRWVMSHGAP